jgi:outer membrane protein assembly factor BamB
MVKWSFAGDGTLDSTPLVAGGVVYEGSSSGALYALDETTGAQLWMDTLGAAVAPADVGSVATWTGLAATNDTLFVPAGSTLTAYGN